MGRGIKIALITICSSIVVILAIFLLAFPYVHTYGTVINGYPSVLSIEAREVTEGSTYASDPFTQYKADILFDYEIRYIASGKEYNIRYIKTIKTKYEPSRNYPVPGDQIEIVYNPVFPGNYKVIMK